ncbi:hypothetical protein V6120_13725, partial [Klebsiella pneumoniae]
MSYQHEHDHTEPPEEIVLRVKALESLLLEKGMIDLAALDQLVDTYEGSSQKTESMVTPVFATPILTTSWLA